MADRILTWYLEEITRDGTRQGPTYCLDYRYVPKNVRVYVGQPPDADNLILDILTDGVSIFTSNRRPTILKGTTGQDWWDIFDPSLTYLDKRTWVSLNVPQNGGAKRITVELELDELANVATRDARADTE